MVLNSLGFCIEVDSAVWSLFEKMDELSEPLECSLEVIDAAMAGRLDLDHFDLSAYAKTVKKNERLANFRVGSKLLPIVFDYNEEDAEPYGVPESVVSIYAEPVDAYEAIVDDEEVRYAVTELTNMNHDITSYYRIDFVRCMTQALKGIPASINLLKQLVCDDPYIGELIRAILSSGHPFCELFAGAA